MAFFRSLKTLIERSRTRSRPFLTSLSTTSLSHSLDTLSPPPPLLPFRSSRFLFRPFLPSSGSRVISPLSELLVSPFHGPLFLSSPLWKLSQSATPVHIQGDVVFFPKKLRALSLLRRTTVNFQIKLPAVKTAVSKIEREEKVAMISDGGDGFAESFLNLPNLVSIGRMLSGPVLGWMIISEWYIPAFVGLAISGATDWLDGFLARKMGINSVVGSYLDPLADKVLIGCVAVAMVENNLLHPTILAKSAWLSRSYLSFLEKPTCAGLVALVVLRDALLVGGAVYNRASSLNWKWKSWSDFANLDGFRPEKVEPLFISKVNTVFQLFLVAAALLQPELGTPETQLYVTYLSWTVAGTTVGSTVGYGAKYMRSRSLSTARSR